MGKAERLDLIKKIQTKRNSKLVTYVLTDRPGYNVFIGSDTPRIFYEHLDGETTKFPKLDVFVYSIGGDTSAPWRIISLFREFAEEVNILVPFRAYSAATLLAIGCDSIVMGKKGELGPIDPTVNSEFNPVDPIVQNRTLAINVEDVTSYIELLKKFGINEQKEIGEGFTKLTQAVNPVALGYINRHYSFIRMVATKLLKSHRTPFDQTKIQKIVKELIEEIYFHGHGIARSEAKDIGLNVIHPDAELEYLMWELFLEYEEDLQLNNPLNAEDILNDNKTNNHILEAIAGGYIESEKYTHIFQGDMKLKAKRAIPQAVTINVNFQLPPGATPNQVNQHQLGPLQQQITQLVMEELERQSDVLAFEARLTRLNWHKRKWS